MTKASSWLDNATGWAFRLGLLGLLAVTGRFGWTAWQHAERSTNKVPSVAPERVAELPRVNPFAVATVPPQLASALTEGGDGGVMSLPRGSSRGELRRAFLTVEVGPDRSEVRVDGVPVGMTPYVGEILCAVGRSVAITLVPPHGASRRVTRICTGGEMKITDANVDSDY